MEFDEVKQSARVVFEALSMGKALCNGVEVAEEVFDKAREEFRKIYNMALDEAC